MGRYCIIDDSYDEGIKNKDVYLYASFIYMYE